MLKDSSATRHIRTLIYGDLAYEFKLIVGKPNFGDQFKKIIKRNKILLNVIKSGIQHGHHATVINPIMVSVHRRQTIQMWNSSGEKGIVQGTTVCLVSAVLSTM